MIPVQQKNKCTYLFILYMTCIQLLKIHTVTFKFEKSNLTIFAHSFITLTLAFVYVVVESLSAFWGFNKCWALSKLAGCDGVYFTWL